jgi:carbonic anhydrase
VDVLRIRHVIVCGHYGCGGVRAAYQDDRMGLVDNWLRHVQDVAQKHRATLEQAGSVNDQVNRLCELNVLEQVANVCQTTVIQDAWSRRQDVTVHGWIYDLADGLIRDLKVDSSSPAEFQRVYRQAQNVYIRS